jgi:hypothetical protein
MGHIHLGRLPKTQAWAGVIASLGGPTLDVQDVARATMHGASGRLQRLRTDPSLAYCVWLLARLASASRRPDFTDAVADLGIPAAQQKSLVGFIAAVSGRARDEVERHPISGPFGDMALQALRKTLTETIAAQPTPLFGFEPADIEWAFARHATETGFGTLLHRFFADFLRRALRFYVDKELSLQVGRGAHLSTSTQAISFLSDLDRHATETARIVAVFSGQWFAKHHWTADGRIGRDETARFVAEAMRKVHDDVLGVVA